MKQLIRVIQKFKETRETSYIYKNELDKVDFKDLKRRTTSDKILRNKVFKIAKNQKHDGYQRGLPSMVYNFFDSLQVVVLLMIMIIIIILMIITTMILKKIYNQQMNFINQLLENF